MHSTQSPCMLVSGMFDAERQNSGRWQGLIRFCKSKFYMEHLKNDGLQNEIWAKFLTNLFQKQIYYFCSTGI